MKVVGYITATFMLMNYAALMNGWALCKLWAWFITPTFGLVQLSIPSAIGLALVVSYLTHQVDDKGSTDSYGVRLIKGAAMVTFKPLIALLLGAVVKLWM